MSAEDGQTAGSSDEHDSSPRPTAQIHGTVQRQSPFEQWANESLLKVGIGVLIGIAALVAAFHHALTFILGGLIIALVGVIANIAWGRKDRIWPFVALATVISVALGTVLVCLAVAPVRHLTSYKRKLVPAEPPIISIVQPIPGSGVGPAPTVSGVISNFRDNEYVMESSQPYTLPGPGKASPEAFYSPGESCNIMNDGHNFMCPSVYNGSRTGDYCRLALLWVSVVDRDQLERLVVDADHHAQIPVIWPDLPMNIYGSADGVLIYRNPAAGQHSCPSL
jgi:hypothetical protein